MCSLSLSLRLCLSPYMYSTLSRNVSVCVSLSVCLSLYLYVSLSLSCFLLCLVFFLSSPLSLSIYIYIALCMYGTTCPCPTTEAGRRVFFFLCLLGDRSWKFAGMSWNCLGPQNKGPGKYLFCARWNRTHFYLLRSAKVRLQEQVAGGGFMLLSVLSHVAISYWFTLSTVPLSSLIRWRTKEVCTGLLGRKGTLTSSVRVCLYQDHFSTPNPQVCCFYFVSLAQKEKFLLRKPDSPY